MTPEAELQKAEHARAVLETPMVRDTLDFMEREIMEFWLACPVRDVDGREALWRMAVTTRKFRDLLRGTMESGKIAAAQIAEKKSLAERAKSTFQRIRK